jgi:hypothetical protein
MNDRKPRLPELPMVPDMNGCWIWPYHIAVEGYGKASNGLPAHREVWKILVGPIAVGMELDHLCLVRACVNPDHLEEVTPEENRRRKYAQMTHCKNSHEFTEENTRIDPKRGRICRACDRKRHRKRVDT